ncbi:MAG: DUF4255 domain-containing protein [Chloroflexi bacterium]|nr:DUF4255 domain-containing protein [Chloroflexota bacterium]
MSNHLTIATVTETLRFLLDAAITPVLGGVTVSTGKPDAATQGDRTPRVNVFLYQAAHNPHWRGDDLPTRTSEGRLVHRPRAALELHYLISCYGEDATLDDQQLLALVVRTLHTHPCLSPDLIDAAVATHAFLRESNLAGERELVRFTPMQLSLEEMSKLWSVFYLTQYELSAAYAGGPVFIESDDTPISILPVLERNIHVLTVAAPTITGIEPSSGPGLPIVHGVQLVVTGRQLLAPPPRVSQVLVDGTPTAFDAQTATDTRLELAVLPTVRVGAHTLQVQHLIPMGRTTQPPPSQPPLHPAFESNLAGFVLQPQLLEPPLLSDVQGTGTSPRSATLHLSVDPPITEDQSATVTLISLADGTTLPPVAIAAGDNPRSVPIQGVPTGDYYVRVTVAGVDSPLTRDAAPNSPTFGLWAGPKVTFA